MTHFGSNEKKVTISSPRREESSLPRKKKKVKKKTPCTDRNRPGRPMSPGRKTLQHRPAGEREREGRVKWRLLYLQDDLPSKRLVRALEIAF